MTNSEIERFDRRALSCAQLLLLAGLLLMVRVGICQTTLTNLASPQAQGKFVKPPEILNSQDAMELAEIETMVRANTPEPEIVQAVRQRGMSEGLDENAKSELRGIGASQGLVQALENFDYVLTPSEKERFQERKAKRENDRSHLGDKLLMQEAAKRRTEEAEASRQSELRNEMIRNASRERENREKSLATMKIKSEPQRIERSIPRPIPPVPQGIVPQPSCPPKTVYVSWKNSGSDPAAKPPAPKPGKQVVSEEKKGP